MKVLRTFTNTRANLLVGGLFDSRARRIDAAGAMRCSSPTDLIARLLPACAWRAVAARWPRWMAAAALALAVSLAMPSTMWAVPRRSESKAARAKAAKTKATKTKQPRGKAAKAKAAKTKRPRGKTAKAKAAKTKAAKGKTNRRSVGMSRRERAKLGRTCKDRRKRKTPACKAYFAAEAEAKEAALVKRCRNKRYRKTASCQALAKKARARSICGRRYGRARKRESLARFAKRHRVSPQVVIRLNGLPAKTGRLRSGKRYLIYRSPFEGERLRDGALLEAEDGVLAMQRPERGWGKPILVQALRAAARATQAGDPRATSLVVGDLSKQGGGCLPPHRSHRGGLDADIGYYHLGGKQRTWLGLATATDIDADRTWQLLAGLRASGQLRYAFIDYDLQPSLYAAALRAGETAESLGPFFQFPRPKSADKSGVIRHLKGHADHMHVRLTCPESGPCALEESLAAAIEASEIAQRGSVGERPRRKFAARSRRRAPAVPELL